MTAPRATRLRAAKRRRAAAVSLPLGLLLLGAGTTAAAMPTHVRQPGATAAGLPIQVFVDGLAPRVVRPHARLTVVGRLRNITSTEIDNIRVRLRVRNRPVGSRSELAADAVRTEPLGVPLDATTIVAATALPPGGTVPFTVQVAADTLQLGVFGVYPFAVEVLGADVGGPNDIVGRTQTFLPWVPAGGGFRPSRLAWLVPLLAEPNRGAAPVFPDDQLAAAVAPGGRLDALLAAGARVGPAVVRPPGTAGRPDQQRPVPVTWAVDPALLQSLADMADGYRLAAPNGRTTPGSGQPTAASWLDRFRRSLHGGRPPDTLLALPYADVDVAALARTELESDIAAATTHGRDVAASVAGVAPDAVLGWPPDGFVTTKALDDLAESGVRTVVLQDSALPPTESLNYTPNAGAAVETRVGPVTALLADGTLGQIATAADRDVLTMAATVAPSSEPSSSSVPSELVTPSPSAAPPAPTAAPMTARLLEQRFLAETAMITAEHPLQSRDVVIAPPSDWNPPAGLATALIADTGRVPWLTPTPLSTIAADTSVQRQPLTYPDSAASAELPRSYLSDSKHGVVAIRRDLSTFRSILVPPIGPTAVALEDATLRTESAWWRSDLATGFDLRTEVADELATNRAAVNISSSRRLITLASRRGTIPITISNDLDQAVVVRLRLSAVSTARLAAPATAAQTIAAGRKLTIEVKAVVNQAGLFPIKAQLLTLDNEPYGPAVTLRLRSTAYGQLALGITVGALGALLLAIVVRLMRRNRRRTASSDTGTS